MNKIEKAREAKAHKHLHGEKLIYRKYGILTRAKFVQRLIEKGYNIPSIEEVPAVKDKTKIQLFRMNQQEQDWHIKRQKEAGTKKIYWLENKDGYSQKLNKTMYDYAVILINSKGGNDEDIS